MKICFIGPGLLPINEKVKSGAIEILTYEMKVMLEKLGHEVFIVNVENLSLAAQITNSIHPEIVMIQYDDYSEIYKKLNCKNVVIGTHTGAYTRKINWGNDRWEENSKLSPAVNLSLNTTLFSDMHVACLSEEIKNSFLAKGGSPDRIHVARNGIYVDNFNFSVDCKKPEKTAYLARVSMNKSQYIYQDISSIDFIGKIENEPGIIKRFRKENPRYLGQWSKERIYRELTNYANLALLSTNEAHALVCMEALAAGLGLVVSEAAAANLDLEKPFIDVIPMNLREDVAYVEKVLEKNRNVSVKMREEIRKYACENFDWSTVIPDYYIPIFNKLLERK